MRTLVSIITFMGSGTIILLLMAAISDPIGDILIGEKTGSFGLAAHLLLKPFEGIYSGINDLDISVINYKGYAVTSVDAKHIADVFWNGHLAFRHDLGIVYE